MDRIERIRRLRDQYETALDDAEHLRTEYRREVVKLHRSGVSLREIAEQLGISHQRVHQIVGVAQPKRRARGIGGAIGALTLVAALSVGLLTSSEREVPSDHPPLANRTAYVACGISVAQGSAFTPLTIAASAAKRCARPGTVVALDPKTGNIVAMVGSADRQPSADSR